MIRINKRGKDYILTIVDKSKRKIQYVMSEKEYMSLVLKGWEDYVRKYCSYARKFCKYERKLHKYVDKFCNFSENICKNFAFTLTKGKK
jgi:hypothetical protein